MINKERLSSFKIESKGCNQKGKISEIFAAYSGYLIAAILSFVLFSCTEKKSGRLHTLGKEEGKVVIASWPGYVERGENDSKYDWISEFEKKVPAKWRTLFSRMNRISPEFFRTEQQTL